MRPLAPALTHGNTVVRGLALTFTGVDQCFPPSFETASIVQVSRVAGCRSLQTTYWLPALSRVLATNESKVSNRRLATSVGAGGVVAPRGTIETRIRSAVVELAGLLHFTSSQSLGSPRVFQTVNDVPVRWSY